MCKYAGGIKTFLDTSDMMMMCCASIASDFSAVTDTQSCMSLQDDVTCKTRTNVNTLPGTMHT